MPFGLSSVGQYVVQLQSSTTAIQPMSISLSQTATKSLACTVNLYDNKFADLITDKRAWLPEDQKATKIMEQSAVLVNGHYQIKLPFRSNPATLNGNYIAAKKRLLALRNRLQKNPVLKQFRSILLRYEREGACSVLYQEGLQKIDGFFHIT